MARKAVAINGSHINGDAPPSTLAAQLVQNQSRRGTFYKSGQTPSFHELLHEILHNEAAVQETDAIVNAQLVSVVIQIGLQALHVENPFADWNVLLSQAVDSIAVVEKTVERQPECLLVSLSPSGPPLLLSLFVTLFTVCGHPKCGDLGIVRLVNSTIATFNASINHWPQAQILRDTVQETVDDVLSALESSSKLSTNISLELPPARSISKLWPNSENALTVPQGCTFSINNVSQALMTALILSEANDSNCYWLYDTQQRIQQCICRFQPEMEIAGIWEDAATRALAFSGSLTLLQLLLQDIGNTMLPETLQKRIAEALVDTLRYRTKLAREKLLPQLIDIGTSEAWSHLHEDVKIAICTWLCRFESPESLPEQITVMIDAIRHTNMMTENDLVLAFHQLSVSDIPNRKQVRIQRRRDAAAPDTGSARTATLQRTAELLTGDRNTEFGALPEVACSAYAALDNIDKCAAWQCIIDCVNYDLTTILHTLSRLLESVQLHGNKQHRIMSILAVQACVARTGDAQYISLATSQFGRHCLACLCSTVRELRIAAARALPSFLREDLPEGVRMENRQFALESLRALSEKDAANEHETLILAWGQVAISCGERELNLVLLQLVEYLGNGNTLIQGLAFSELETIAAARKQPPIAMFRPFWRSIAVSVVQDLNVRPQKIQQLCELLNIEVPKFLILTQRDTLPTLVLTRRKDIIQRISLARGDLNSVRDVCWQPLTNLAAILTTLLTQSSGDIEEMAFSCLTDADSEFSKTTLSELIKQDSVLVACEMLKHCGEQSESRKSKAYQAFQIFANIEQASAGQRKSKSSRAVASFFDLYLLGVLTHFSTRLEESGPAAESLAEKSRCLNGLREVFILTKGNVSAGLPQIRACLQSALQQPDLTETAFANWLTLMPLLEGDDVKDVIDEVFVLIVRHWHVLSADLQRRTHDMISELVKAHNTMLQENIMTLPSLAGIPLLQKFAAEFERLKSRESVESQCKAFTKRLRVDGDLVVLRALEELVPFLEAQQGFVHDNAASEHPSTILSELICALLDVTVKYCAADVKMAHLCGKALGIVGSLDPNRIEATRKERPLMVLSNFDTGSETIDWVMALFENVLVKAFKSVNNVRVQGFLAFAMQELLKICEIPEHVALRTRSSQITEASYRWEQLPEHIRTTLTPFLSSRYMVTGNHSVKNPDRTYPSFSPDCSPAQWLRSITTDLLFKAKGDNAKGIFPLLARTIRSDDLSIARFVFPFAALNVILGGVVAEHNGLVAEFLAVLQASSTRQPQQECIRSCSESVFAVLDYLAIWLTEKRKQLADVRAAAHHAGHSPNEFNEAQDMGQIETVGNFLAMIPAEVIAHQALECRSYARALFHWEQHIRSQRSIIPSGQLSSRESTMYDRLQEIYTQIDEPDGLEGIAMHLPIISEHQQAFNHAKSGRWTAAQTWYELQLDQQPDDTSLQYRVLRCLKETGQYGTLLRYADSFLKKSQGISLSQDALETHLPLMFEACWMTENVVALQRISTFKPQSTSSFSVHIGRLLLRAAETSDASVTDVLQALRKFITESLSMSGTASLQNCHDELVKLHVIYEVEALMTVTTDEAPKLLQAFDKRLAAVGSYTQDKQYILGIRRAVMRLRPDVFRGAQIGAAWLSTARLARQARNTSSAYNAVLKASECHNCAAKLEQARLLWHDGHQRQAIQSLEAAIASGVFVDAEDDTLTGNRKYDASGVTDVNGHKQDRMSARAMLLLAKWLDASGQTQTKAMTDRYQKASIHYQRWEKGHYYLGKHYSKLLDAEKLLPQAKRSQAFVTGDLTKLVIDNSLRSVAFGHKYWHETIPKVLTLWLALGAEVVQRGHEDISIYEKRVKALQGCNKQFQKYFDRIPAYVFYRALPQLISRITHPHADVWKQICNILVRITASHPSQALWSIFPVLKAKDPLRVERGKEVLEKLKDPKNLPKSSDASVNLRALIQSGQRLCDGLLQASEKPVAQRVAKVNLVGDLKFNPNLAPNQLVVPIQATLTASTPASSDSMSIRHHKAFTQDKITIQSFMNDVLVLNSLQRPRKITIRGSDGKQYGLLCKPKDDLRKDQRLMDFNDIINRALKRDTESSKRRLYIKTNAVTPLSEESGCIEWVEGIRPLRDILLGIYNRKGIRPDYAEIKRNLDEASSAPSNAHIFADKVLSQFPLSMHEWFSETYPEPDLWFAARLRFARSAAVMSMTGHMLGLGDRHGENILLEEGTGGVFHVDFNCLFDKGLTLEKPELVPFRLTPNMQDAMGPYGHEGPFRKSCELTLGLLRQERDTLMTVLETFLYDPTTDFVGKKKRAIPGVPETPAEILESVAIKLKGHLPEETVPLGVEGYVDALIQQATNHFRLASMYIGWCSFL